MAPILVVQRPLTTLERALPFAHKPYAIHERDGTSSPPVVFSEQKEVLGRLAKKFWPGPLMIYLNQQQMVGHNDCGGGSKVVPWLFSVKGCSSSGKQYYVGVSNPTHPLTNRLLREASSSEPHAPQRVVLATAVRTNSGGTNRYMTKADDVCSHFASQFSPDSEPSTKQTQQPQQQDPLVVHVMNGEDKRELFSVPTCQYGKPYPYSLWIDDCARVVYIRGNHSEGIGDTARRQSQPENATISSTNAATSGSVAVAVKAVLTSVASCLSSSSSPSTTDDKRLQNRNRVVAAVLRKWKVVDQRTGVV